MSEKSNSSRQSTPQHHLDNRLHGSVTATLEQLEETERHMQRGHGLNAEHSKTIRRAVAHLRTRVRDLRPRIGTANTDERWLATEVHATGHIANLLEQTVIALSAADRLAQRVATLLSSSQSESMALVALQDASEQLVAHAHELDRDLTSGLNRLREATAAAAIEYSHLGA